MQNFGLKPTPADPRDYSYHKTFGAASAVLPDSYFAGRPKVKHQHLSQMCTAFASYVLAACEDGMDFLPEWSFAAGKLISKSDPEAPEDLRTPLKTAVTYGYLPDGPGLPSLASESPRQCANLASYPAGSMVIARAYRKKSYFRVDGDFDSVRQTLFRNASVHRAIITGVLWMNEWTVAKGGIVPKIATEVGGLHCIAIIGFTTIAGVEYVVVQNSYGSDIGDHGLFYFDRETFNKWFTEPMYMLVDFSDTDGAPSPVGNFFSLFLYKLLKLL